MVNVCNGETLNRYCSDGEDGFTPSGRASSMPHLTPMKGRGVLWAAMICVPHPRCKGIRTVAKNCSKAAIFAAVQPGRKKSNPNHGSQPLTGTKRAKLENDPVGDGEGKSWGDTPAWFREWAVKMCASEGLPQLRHMIKYGSLPMGVYSHDDPWCFQVTLVFYTLK